MSVTLDKIVSYYVKKVGTNSLQQGDEGHLLLEAAERKIRESIEEEIKAEARQEIIEDANKEIEKIKNEKRIRELKEIIWSGFLVAFIVGLLVNQITEIIGYFKGTQNMVISTYWISLVLFFICVIAFIVMFINRIKSIYQDIKNGKI